MPQSVLSDGQKCGRSSPVVASPDVEVTVVLKTPGPGHNSMTSVDTPSGACLGSTRRAGEVSASRARFARDQSVVRQPSPGADGPVRSPRGKRDEGGIAREVEQAQ